MKEKSTGTGAESRPTWESLEALARQGVQRLLQQLLEEEVEQVVGRRRYERRDGVDAAPGYRNGLGKPRRLSTMTGTITIRRPRLRGLGHDSRAGCCRCSSGARKKSADSCRSCTCTGWPRETSTWPCGGCWERRRRCRPRRLRG